MYKRKYYLCSVKSANIGKNLMQNLYIQTKIIIFVA